MITLLKHRLTLPISRIVYFLKTIQPHDNRLITHISREISGPRNSWRASDPRCRGEMQHMRIGRSVTSNNRRTQQGFGGGQLWRFNGNSGSCEMVYGSAQHDNDVFDSHGDCEKECLNSKYLFFLISENQLYIQSRGFI